MKIIDKVIRNVIKVTKMPILKAYYGKGMTTVEYYLADIAIESKSRLCRMADRTSFFGVEYAYRKDASF